MGFMEAVQTAIFKRFADFQGRSSRSEYWWFFLFNFFVNIIINVITVVVGPEIGMILSVIVMLALIIPGIALTIRRFHDLDKSGWWILIGFIPLIGLILFIYWFVQRGTDGDNRFGPDPLGGMNVADRFS